MLTLNLAGRKLVDLDGPHGWQYAALNLGRLQPLEGAPAPGVRASLRAAQPLVELGAPFRVSLAELDKELSLATDNGYPVRKRIEQQILDGPVRWAPAVPGAVLLSVRGGDFVLTIGEDLSIGYSDHDRENVELYLVESLAFRVLEGSAAIHLKPSN